MKNLIEVKNHFIDNALGFLRDKQSDAATFSFELDLSFCQTVEDTKRRGASPFSYIRLTETDTGFLIISKTGEVFWTYSQSSSSFSLGASALTL